MKNKTEIIIIAFLLVICSITFVGVTKELAKAPAESALLKFLLDREAGFVKDIATVQARIKKDQDTILRMQGALFAVRETLKEAKKIQADKDAKAQVPVSKIPAKE